MIASRSINSPFSLGPREGRSAKSALPKFTPRCDHGDHFPLPRVRVACEPSIGGYPGSRTRLTRLVRPAGPGDGGCDAGPVGRLTRRSTEPARKRTRVPSQVDMWHAASRTGSPPYFGLRAAVDPVGEQTGQSGDEEVAANTACQGVRRAKSSETVEPLRTCDPFCSPGVKERY